MLAVVLLLFRRGPSIVDTAAVAVFVVNFVSFIEFINNNIRHMF
jgi:hypothetical protein